MTRSDIPEPVEPTWASIDAAMRELDSQLAELRVLPPRLRVPQRDAQLAGLASIEDKLRTMGLGLQADQAREIRRASAEMLTSQVG